MRSLPLSVQTTYQDLLEAHKMRQLVDLGGTAHLRRLKGRGDYWYATQRVGNRVINRYIGPDSPELRARLEVAKGDAENAKALETRCAGLVAQLRAAGLPALDRDTGKVLNALARVGVFRLGGTLVGTHAYRLYDAELGVRLEDAPAVTEDIDIAAFENLKLVIEDQVDPSLADTFSDLKLTPAPGLDPKHRPTRWAMAGGGTMVDFLTPRMRENATVLRLAPLGVYAQALAFLNFLIAEPIPAVALYRSGVLVQIPRPERYAVHKLIVAQRRNAGSTAKRRKDLDQSETLIRALAEDRPHELQDAYRTARKSGPKWREAIDRSLNQKPEIAAMIRSL